ncbi:MAG: ChbG/HpnK family deacetylase [Crocinitomicaceae bacterium]|nr:ChbG/HpnK family deacetylase [Crocinitomicaceae bacterium]
MITADDFGVHNFIDDAIVDCIDKLDCIDAIVTHSTSDERIKNLLKNNHDKFKNNKVKLGLHLNLTCGTPRHLPKNSTSYLNAISKFRYSKGGSHKKRQFKHKRALTIIPKLDNLLDYHKKHLVKELEEQYNSFRKFTKGMIKGQEDMKPYHISAHLGVYNATEELYDILKEFCLKEDVPMRCPTLLFYDTDKDMKDWTKDKQKLLPEWKLNAMRILENGWKINAWMRRRQKAQFLIDRKELNLPCTDFFIEHFFKQGEIEHWTEILERIVENKSGKYSYEMVVHPVNFDKNDDLDTLPHGIDKNSFKKRKVEYKTLMSQPIRKQVKDAGIGVFKF